MVAKWLTDLQIAIFSNFHLRFTACNAIEMKIPNKKWLDSLLPLCVAAKQFTKGDENLCRQKARVYDSLVFMGVKADMYVDANRYNFCYFEEKAERAKTKGREVLHLRDGQMAAADLQDLIADLEAHLYGNMSRIAALREANTHTTDLAEIKQIEIEMEGLRIQLPALVEDRKNALDKLAAIVRDFGFTPVAHPAEPQPAPAVTKGTKKSAKKSAKKAAKKVTVKREPRRSRKTD